jgi:hypothetical protein
VSFWEEKEGCLLAKRVLLFISCHFWVLYTATPAAADNGIGTKTTSVPPQRRSKTPERELIKTNEMSLKHKRN